MTDHGDVDIVATGAGGGTLANVLAQAVVDCAALNRVVQRLYSSV